LAQYKLIRRWFDGREVQTPYDGDPLTEGQKWPLDEGDGLNWEVVEGPHDVEGESVPVVVISPRDWTAL
jgi:hypothetical protein